MPVLQRRQPQTRGLLDLTNRMRVKRGEVRVLHQLDPNLLDKASRIEIGLSKIRTDTKSAGPGGWIQLAYDMLSG